MTETQANLSPPPTSPPVATAAPWPDDELRERESRWRKSLKVGDEVLFQYRGNRPWRGGVVEKATKMHVVVGGRKIRRKDGYEVNHNYSDRIVEPLPELVKAIENDRRRESAGYVIERLLKVWRRDSRDKGIKKHDIDLEKLEAIAAAIDAAIPESLATVSPG